MSATAILWSKHRVEALTDGIFAVAMTLLVIELKLPALESLRSEAELQQALANLAAKALSWLLSFYVLAIFWLAHHRLFHFVRSVDGPLLWRNLHQLAFVSLMPFSAALVGEYGWSATAQILYNGNMAALGALGLAKLVYVYRHPELASQPMGRETYHAALLRTGAVIVIAAVAIVIGLVSRRFTAFAPTVYLLMIPVGVFSRRLERAARPQDLHDHEHS